jgi:protease-4
VFFKLLFFSYLFLMTWMLWPKDTITALTKPHVAKIDIDGQIDANANASADNIIDSLHDAYKDSNTKAIILDINSPGGSAVQAATVYDEIMRQKQLHKNIKVYAVCSDACASAAYYMASAADDIYANKASLVGSIGVLIDGFGFTDAMNKFGVQRRLLTSGDHKGFLDPFSPENPADLKFAQGMLDSVHAQFEQSVEQGRGSRLKITPETFSGLVWTGKQALDMGLIDGFGTTQTVARDIIKNKNIVDYTSQPDFFNKLSGDIGASISYQLAEMLGITKSGVKAQY